jgi:DeoR/GlpR family transcriptional regulator of sugar metabolism
MLNSERKNMIMELLNPKQTVTVAERSKALKKGRP